MNKGFSERMLEALSRLQQDECRKYDSSKEKYQKNLLQAIDSAAVLLFFLSGLVFLYV